VKWPGLEAKRCLIAHGRMENRSGMTGSVEPTAYPELRSEISCPYCGHRKVEEMPTDACRFFYECEGCGTLLRPKAGHCCVFCSYGSVPCPPVQLERRGDGDGSCCR
jgi:hypothetical protein